MPNGKASGPDDISVETLKAGGASLDQQLAKSIYQMLERKQDTQKLKILQNGSHS